ncbi:hypothetical protein [Gracilimonas sp.]|uniref:hypothetical protein n=1 Tax=Gracilimonas sp. TaxID=1974203 RepID=UPI0032EC1E4C
MRAYLIFIITFLISCSAPDRYQFRVLDISDEIDGNLLLANDFFQISGDDVVAFDKQINDTLIVVQLDNTYQNVKASVISWTFPASSKMNIAKAELEKLGITRLQQLYGCENIEESCTFIGQTKNKNTFRIYWGENLETDVFPDEFDKDYKLRIEYSFDPTFDKTYSVN